MTNREQHQRRSPDNDPQAIIDGLVRGSAPNSLETLQALQTLCLEAEERNDLRSALCYNAAGSEFIEIAPPSFKSAEVTFQLTRGRLLFKNGQLTEAAEALRTALEVSAQTSFLSEEHRNLTCYQACHILAGIRHKQGSSSEAYRLLSMAHSFACKRFGEESLEAIGLLLEKAQTSIAASHCFKTFLIDSHACKRAILGRNQINNEQAGALALDLGSLYYECGVWDEASSLLQASVVLSSDTVRKTKALLTLAHISVHQTESSETSRYLDEAMSLWMDRAFPPHLDRHMANLRALVAQTEGDESKYLEYLQQACQKQPDEDISFEGQIELHCRRATFLRMKGFHEEAALEIEQAEMLVSRGIVSPAQRFKFALERGYVLYNEGNFDGSRENISRALAQIGESLQHNPILVARAHALRAYNNHALAEEASDHSTASRHHKETLRDGEAALKLLSSADAEHSLQKQLLRLLIGTCQATELQRPIPKLEAQLERVLFRFPD